MASFIIYSTDHKYLDRTIDDLIDHTPSAILDEIIVCDDAPSGCETYRRPGVKVMRSHGIGRAKAWNRAAADSKGDQLAFLKSRTRFGQDWFQPLQAVLARNQTSIVSPIVYSLDLGLWMSENSRWRRFGWRWDLNLYDRAYVGKEESAAASSYCLVMHRNWFRELGGFDDGMGPGAGEDIEITLRSWLFGGAVIVADESEIAAALELDYEPRTINNLARIVEVWLPNQASHFYNARGVRPEEVDVGRLTNLVRLQDRQRRPAEWFLANHLPELLSIYHLKNLATGRTVAVIWPGPSLDYMNRSMIQRHDMLIGVDYVGLLFDCDFVLADTVHVVAELRKKYRDEQLVLPVALHDNASGELVATAEVAPLSTQFEMARTGTIPTSVDPPLCNFDNLGLCAVQFALFLNPVSVTLFGCDNKIIDNKSHTSKIEYYDGGRVWPDNNATRKRFALYEFGLDQLGRLALAHGIPLLRVCHA